MTKKRTSLMSAMKAAKDKVEPSASSSKPAAGEANGYTTTAINIRRDQWVLLGDVANARRKSKGGRQSVSDIIRDLIEANRKSLEAEVNK